MVIAVEPKAPKGFGRVVMRHVPDSTSNFVRENVDEDSVIQADEWNEYNLVQTNSYLHQPTNLPSKIILLMHPHQLRTVWQTFS